MANIVAIFGELDESSLVLFDELGAGTDPVEGAALAGAIIDSATERGAFVAATTHYAELKAYAAETEGIENASCEFDVETLRPTYKLIMGTPGRSNAFAIASKLGLSEDIITLAGRRIDAQNRTFDKVISNLEDSKRKTDAEHESLLREREAFEKEKRDIEAEIKTRLADAKKTSEKASEKAAQLVESARTTASFVLDSVEKLRKKEVKEVTKEELDEIRRTAKELLPPPDFDTEDDDGYVLPRPLKKGDRVTIRGLGKEGILADNPDKDGNVRVSAGSIITKTNVSKLRLVETKKPPEKVSSSDKKPSLDGSFSLELDLRGMNGDDAWFECDKYLDDAILYGINSVRIIHGKGTGALRRSLWNEFKHDPRVEIFRQGAYGEGDTGVTVVELAVE
jgi:DNA mismatch repair protein MutS2